MVLKTINKFVNPDEITVEDIYMASKSLDKRAINLAIEFLSNNGLIYPKFDDLYFVA